MGTPSSKWDGRDPWVRLVDRASLSEARFFLRAGQSPFSFNNLSAQAICSADSAGSGTHCR